MDVPANQHPPYAPPYAAVGGVPTVGVDVPICAVFLVLFLIGAASHMTILQLNRRKGHKFLISGLLFGFCMARIVTNVMRIVWACHPHNVRVAIAAMVFVSAGVLILLLVNLNFAQRILRAAHPHFGWHKALSRAFLVMYILIGVLLAVVITGTVQSFYTLNRNTRRIDADLQRTAVVYFDVISFLPIPMVVIGLLAPRKTRVEKFGTGRWRTKIRILLTASALLCAGATFRTSTVFKTPRLRSDPAWYDARWCFYVFNFTVEIIVVYLYIIVRIDRRFWVPNGSKGPGDYSSQAPPEKIESEGEDDGRPQSQATSVTRIMTEEEVFDGKFDGENDQKNDEETGRPSESSTLRTPSSPKL